MRPDCFWPTRSLFSKREPPLLAEQGQRVCEPTPEMPALIILIDEYAELVDDAPGAIRHADSIARRGRAVAVSLIAATQRPTQKAMGHGAVRSQMDVRICFRVRERKDVDLILGQGMLAAGWQAHTLDAPGKFLVSAAEHDTPRRGRAYLITDEVVATTAGLHADLRPPLDEISQQAIEEQNRDKRAAAARQEAGEAGEPHGPSPDAEDKHGSADDDPEVTLVGRAVPGSGRRRHRARPHDRDRHEPTMDLPTAARTYRTQPSRPGQPGTVARSEW